MRFLALHNLNWMLGVWSKQRWSEMVNDNSGITILDEDLNE